MDPSEEHVTCMFFTPFDCFSRKGTLFLLFVKFQNRKRMYPSEGNSCFFTPVDCSYTVLLVRVHFFLLFFKFQNNKKSTVPRKMYVFLLLLIVFLVSVHFFDYFSNLNKVKKAYRSEGIFCFSILLTVFIVKVHFFLFFSRYISGHCFFTIFF